MPSTAVPSRTRRYLSVVEWEALEDPWGPGGGRYEILDGWLTLNPAPSGDHNRYGEDLADMIRGAIDDAGLDLDVHIDVEWRVVQSGRVTQAPRGDIVVGPVHESNKYLDQLPRFVVEIWSATSRPSVRTRKRQYWTARGLRHYWSVRLGAPPTIEVYDLLASPDPSQVATGDQTLSITEPFPLAVRPSDVRGWTLRQHREAKRAHQAVADLERLRASGVDVDAILGQDE